jgi:hypothetical protein
MPAAPLLLPRVVEALSSSRSECRVAAATVRRHRASSIMLQQTGDSFTCFSTDQVGGGSISHTEMVEFEGFQVDRGKQEHDQLHLYCCPG